MLGPESEGARPCFPESGQRPRQWGNQDGASCHTHNLGVSNTAHPRAVGRVTFRCDSNTKPGAVDDYSDTPNPQIWRDYFTDGQC